MKRSRQLWPLAFTLTTLAIAPPSAMAGWKAIKPLQMKHKEEDSVYPDTNPYCRIQGGSFAFSSGNLTTGDAPVTAEYGFVLPEPALPPFTYLQGLYYPLVRVGESTFAVSSEADESTSASGSTFRRTTSKEKLSISGNHNVTSKRPQRGSVNIPSGRNLGLERGQTGLSANLKPISIHLTQVGNTYDSTAVTKEQEETDDVAIIKCPTISFSITQMGMVSVEAKTQIKPSETAESGGTATVVEDGTNKDIYLALLEHWACP